MAISVLDGIIIGAVGGAFAGIAVYLVQYLHSKIVLFMDKRRVFQWLSRNTTMEPGKNFRSTRSIASWTNITEERVRHVCSAHKMIYLSTGDMPDMWGVLTKGIDRVDSFL